MQLFFRFHIHARCFLSCVYAFFFFFFFYACGFCFICIDVVFREYVGFSSIFNGGVWYAGSGIFSFACACFVFACMSIFVSFA